jgi:hypothetical protein
MKFCPVVSEICRGKVHGPRKERRRIIIIIIIIIINGAKTISLKPLFGRLNQAVLKYSVVWSIFSNYLAYKNNKFIYLSVTY